MVVAASLLGLAVPYPISFLEWEPDSGSDFVLAQNSRLMLGSAVREGRGPRWPLPKAPDLISAQPSSMLKAPTLTRSVSS